MFHKILAAIDMSKAGRRVFEEALNLAKANGASLMLLHVLSPDEEGCPDIGQLSSINYYFPAEHNENTEFYQQQWEAFANKGLELLQLCTKTATTAGVSAEFIQTAGSPGKAICDLACTWEADLIVIGRRGLSGLSQVFLGSVSNYAIHHAPCSVLIVQSPGKASTQPVG